MQNGKDPDCKFFQNIARQGHYSGEGTPSKQGIYVVSADGSFLSSINSLNANAVIKTLKTGLARFEQLDESAKKIADEKQVESVNRFENREPKNGLILAVYSRDLPEDLKPESDRATRWNRDTAWFSKKELLSLVPAAPVVGNTFKLPQVFTERMARFHLVDTINGQTDSFRSVEVAGSKLTGKITRVNVDEVEFQISGNSKSDSNSERYGRTPRGVVTNVWGTAIYSKSKQSFSKLDFVAVGQRWGRTRFNDRRRGPKTNAVGFAVTLAPSDEPTNVPGLFYEYDVEWKNRPVGE
ncbi:MAG: hypothetical protein AB8B55_19975 [Mariniblastus sp.]